MAVCRLRNETNQKLPEKAILECIEKTVEQYGNKKDFFCTVLMVSDEKIKQLNLQFKNKNSPTDVLSFLSIEKKYKGEIIISPTFIKKQKSKNGFKWEICHAAVHGTFHLLGIHHEDIEEGHKKIHQLETKIINSIIVN